MKRIVLAMTLAIAGCTVTPAQPGPDRLAPLANRQDAPQLAMLEHILGEYFSADITNPPTVCAAVHDGREAVALSPQDETALIARYPQLAPLSRCTLSPNGWMDDETEQPALVFTLHSFTCPSDTRCTGWAGYRSSQSNSMSELYTAEWRGSRWHFTRDPRIIAE